AADARNAGLGCIVAEYDRCRTGPRNGQGAEVVDAAARSRAGVCPVAPGAATAAVAAHGEVIDDLRAVLEGQARRHLVVNAAALTHVDGRIAVLPLSGV